MLRNEEILSQTYVTSRRLAVEDFMVCPLCGAINVNTNAECFVCSWRGEFSFNPAQVETRLYEIIYRCPDLLEVLVEEERTEKLGFVSKVRRFFHRFHRKLDVRV